MATELLEKRLGVIDNETSERVKDALKVRHINPRQERDRMPYLKYDLTDFITEYLSRRSNTPQDFSKVLYSAVNKEPLKRVWYGICSVGNMPREFLDALTNWEKIYFFAGRWAIRNPDLQEPVVVLTVRHLKEGLDSLYEHHFVRKARGEYTRQLELPEDREVREAYERIMINYIKSFRVPKSSQPHVRVQQKKQVQKTFLDAPPPYIH